MCRKVAWVVSRLLWLRELRQESRGALRMDGAELDGEISLMQF